MNNTKLTDLINSLNKSVEKEITKREELENTNTETLQHTNSILLTLEAHEIMERLTTVALNIKNGLSDKDVPAAVGEVNYLATVVTMLGGIMDVVYDDEGIDRTDMQVLAKVETHVLEGAKRNVLKLSMSRDNGKTIHNGLALTSDPVSDTEVELCLYKATDNGLQLTVRHTMPLGKDIAVALYETSRLAYNDVVEPLEKPLSTLYEKGILVEETVEGLTYEGDVSYGVSVETLLDIKQIIAKGEEVPVHAVGEETHGDTWSTCSYCGGEQPDCYCYEEEACSNCGDLIDYFSTNNLCDYCLEEEEEEEVDCDCIMCKPIELTLPQIDREEERLKELVDNTRGDRYDKELEDSLLADFVLKLLMSKG